MKTSSTSSGQIHAGRELSVQFNILGIKAMAGDDNAVILRAINAITSFSDGDWGESPMKEANDACLKAGAGAVHGLYGDIAVSGTIEKGPRNELFVLDTLVRTRQAARDTPLPYVPTNAGA